MLIEVMARNIAYAPPSRLAEPHPVCINPLHIVCTERMRDNVWQVTTRAHQIFEMDESMHARLKAWANRE